MRGELMAKYRKKPVTVPCVVCDGGVVGNALEITPCPALCKNGRVVVTQEQVEAMLKAAGLEGKR